MSNLPAEPRYSMNRALGIVPGKPWAVRDHTLGHAAQTAGLTGPLAYFATEEEARVWAEGMNARHFAGTAPAYEVEDYRGDSADQYLKYVARNTPDPDGVGAVKFVRSAE